VGCGFRGTASGRGHRSCKDVLAVRRARLRLENEQLFQIRDKLKENEDSFIQCMQDLDQALSDLQDVQKVLVTTAAFLEIIGRIVTLAA
jgi:hypothetical protein